jgi:hypothetical protein
MFTVRECLCTILSDTIYLKYESLLQLMSALSYYPILVHNAVHLADGTYLYWNRLPSYRK